MNNGNAISTFVPFISYRITALNPICYDTSCKVFSDYFYQIEDDQLFHEVIIFIINVYQLC